MPHRRPSIGSLFGPVALLLLLSAAVAAQSTDQNFPSPVRTNEISGVIKARDIGDSRLTTHYYTFVGGQGDLFVNVQTSNFSGDLDVYAMPGLRPLTKMVIYADSGTAETGRVIYLRKPETILLRIEGRTPGDDEATYRIKFAGSFVASNAAEVFADVPKAVVEQDSGVRVNSVGTIVGVRPKSTPAPQAVDRGRSASNGIPSSPTQDASLPDEKQDDREKADVARSNPPRESTKKREAVRNLPRNAPAADRRSSDPAGVTENREIKPSKRADKGKSVAEANPSTPAPEIRNNKKTSEDVPDPMAKVRLVIRFKDGSTIERPMTDVFKFTVERAVLTVISKDGAIGRYQMVDVAGVTIE